ncbi:MAG: hypothetical protein IT337_11520 [Thermomicrobiales bacterium]|nr:hypothetical protein [Thermomicrobiales bacterium]
MPAKRSAAESIADRISDLLDRIFGPFTTPAKPALAPVPINQPRPVRR